MGSSTGMLDGYLFWLCAGALALILAVAASCIVARQLSTTDEPASADDEAHKTPPVAETNLDVGTWFDDEGTDDSFNPNITNPLFEASSDEDDGGYIVTHEVGNPSFDSWTDSEDGASDVESYMEVTADALPINVGRLKFGKEEDRELERANVEKVLNNDLHLPTDDFTFALIKPLRRVEKVDTRQPAQGDDTEAVAWLDHDARHRSGATFGLGNVGY